MEKQGQTPDVLSELFIFDKFDQAEPNGTICSFGLCGGLCGGFIIYTHILKAHQSVNEQRRDELKQQKVDK